MAARSLASAAALAVAVLLSSLAQLASALPTPQVTELATLLKLTDDQLWDIFTQASPPSYDHACMTLKEPAHAHPGQGCA